MVLALSCRQRLKHPRVVDTSPQLQRCDSHCRRCRSPLPLLSSGTPTPCSDPTANLLLEACRQLPLVFRQSCTFSGRYSSDANASTAQHLGPARRATDSLAPAKDSQRYVACRSGRRGGRSGGRYVVPPNASAQTLSNHRPRRRRVRRKRPKASFWPLPAISMVVSEPHFSDREVSCVQRRRRCCRGRVSRRRHQRQRSVAWPRGATDAS